jgi:hypothetical protein
LQLATSTHDGTADSAWLGVALEYARANGQARVVDHLEAVLDDVVFEIESLGGNFSASRARVRVTDAHSQLVAEVRKELSL